MQASYTVAFFCALFSLAASLDCANVNVINPNTSLDIANSGMAVGYNAANQTIVALGGLVSALAKQKFSYDVTMEEFSFESNSLSIALGFAANGYTQVDDTLWMLNTAGSRFVTYNLLTGELKQTRIAIPTYVGEGACLTSHNNHLLVVGGITRFTRQQMRLIQAYDLSSEEWLANVPELQTPRNYLDCTVAQGTLYAIGGYTTLSRPVSTIEAVSVADMNAISQQDSRLLVEELVTQQFRSTIVAYGSDVFIIGGHTSSGFVDSIVKLDTTTDTLTSCATLPTGAMNVAPIIVNSTLYIFGGDSQAGYLDTWYYMDLELYTPTTPAPTITEPTTTPAPTTKGCDKYNASLSTAKLPKAQSNLAVGATTSDVYLMGDQIEEYWTFSLTTSTFTVVDGESYTETSEEALSRWYGQLGDVMWFAAETGDGFESFDLTTQTWQENVTFPAPVGKTYSYACVASTMDRYLFVVGGKSEETGEPLDTVQVYDTVDETWMENVPSLNLARYGADCVVADDMLYVIGGFAVEGMLDVIETLSIAEMSKIAEETFQMLQGVLEKAFVGSRSVSYGKDILVLGGWDGEDYVSAVTVIDTKTQQVSVCGSLEVAASYMAPIIVGETLLVFGGRNDKSELATLENLDTVQFIDLPALTTTSSTTTMTPVAPTGKEQTSTSNGGSSGTTKSGGGGNDDTTSSGSSVGMSDVTLVVVIAISVMAVVAAGAFMYFFGCARKRGVEQEEVLLNNNTGGNAEYHKL